MREHGVPLLALALAGAAGTQAHDPFTQAVSAMDAADRVYREAVEATLPPPLAHAMLSAMAAFREFAHRERESATREMREIYVRNRREWDWLDPLDVHATPPLGFSHADATRISAIGDRARSRVDGMRTQANEQLARELTDEQMHALRGAKVRRRDAFTAIVRDALGEPLRGDEKTVDRLVQLADGWY